MILISYDNKIDIFKERPLRYQRTTGLVASQMQELVRRVRERPPEWNKKVGRPKSCGLYRAVEIACIYLRQNATQEFLGDLRDISQATVSRIVTTLVPIINAVLEESVPTGGRHRGRPGPGMPGGRHDHAMLVLRRPRGAVES